MQLQESGEMYLETILILTEKSPRIRSIDVSEYMGFSKPSVSRAIGLLKNGGYVQVDNDGYLSLTADGYDVARRIYERHRLLKEFFTAIGVSEEIASVDACRVEHVLSVETFEAIKNFAKRNS